MQCLKKEQECEGRVFYRGLTPRCAAEWFQADETRAVSFLNGFKNIPEKACVNRFHNNYAFVNVVNLHTRKTFKIN